MTAIAVTKLEINIGDKALSLTPEEARQLYEVLKSHFGMREEVRVVHSVGHFLQPPSQYIGSPYTIRPTIIPDPFPFRCTGQAQQFGTLNQL